MERLRTLYETYLTEVQEAAARLEPTDGLAGFGAGLAGAPCHDRFAERFEALMAEMAAEADSARSRLALEYIYNAPPAQTEQTVYWMLIAVQGMTLPLIERLERRDARELWEQYQKLYSPWERLPVQKKVLSALRARGG